MGFVKAKAEKMKRTLFPQMNPWLSDFKHFGNGLHHFVEVECGSSLSGRKFPEPLDVLRENVLHHVFEVSMGLHQGCSRAGSLVVGFKRILPEITRLALCPTMVLT